MQGHSQKRQKKKKLCFLELWYIKPGSVRSRCQDRIKYEGIFIKGNGCERKWKGAKSDCKSVKP